MDWESSTKRTRRREFLDEMDRVVLWSDLVAHIGMKAHIGVDADSGMAHTVRGTAGHVNDVVEVNCLQYGQETDVFAHAGSQGAHKRPVAMADMQCM